jgi:hypothetical protein
MLDKTGKEIVEQLRTIAQNGSTSIEGIDLSFRDILGVNLLLRNTANMYACRAAGLYRFPLVYGNGIKNGNTNAQAYTSAGGAYQANFVNHLGNTLVSPFIERNPGCSAASVVLLGQSAQGMISEVKLISGADCRYIQFTLESVPATNGIAVIAVKDANGKVMWSWTIWVTTDNLIPEPYENHTGVEYQLLIEAIGTIWNADRTRCVSPLYQWGRKDMLGIPSAYDTSSLMTMYDISGNAVTWGTYGVANDADAGGTVRSVANSIQMPDKFFLQYNESYYNWNNLAWFNNFWNAALNVDGDLDDNQANAIKTIYDPCPVGYMLPAGRFATGFTTTGSNSGTASEFNVVGSFANGWNFKKNSADAVGAYWPASGYRDRASGGLNGVGSNGYYWSFAPHSQANARNLFFSSGYVYPLNNNYRANGFSVRPSRELN